MIFKKNNFTSYKGSDENYNYFNYHFYKSVKVFVKQIRRRSLSGEERGRNAENGSGGGTVISGGDTVISGRAGERLADLYTSNSEDPYRYHASR